MSKCRIQYRHGKDADLYSNVDIYRETFVENRTGSP
jgi:hypothetical protein